MPCLLLQLARRSTSVRRIVMASFGCFAIGTTPIASAFFNRLLAKYSGNGFLAGYAAELVGIALGYVT